MVGKYIYFTRLKLTVSQLQGMNKMVVDKHDKLFVTNDAATITRELEVIHPAARMLVAAAQLQEQQVKIFDFSPKYCQVF